MEIQNSKFKIQNLNEKGIALVMVLVLSAIALAMVSALLFMVIHGTRLSGYHRFFRTAEEAGLGGAEIAAAFIESRGVPTANLTAMVSTQGSACLAQKMSTTRGGVWPASAGWTSCVAANDVSMDPTTNPDLQFDLSNFRVYTKIVDTVEGNTASGGLVTGGGSLGGSGVVSASSGITSPPRIPYLYRVEIQAEATANPRERSRYSGLYAY
ncbi:MAG: hypothetical protein HY035_08845 [Nitrospirae bacterium]|nr:hypothetical protein [Nitrospirota bacterium]MBI3378486.1 hypothetical protein [Nitrospirota bacterium]